MNFREKWLDAVSRKKSVLCAGLDPAVFEMGRGEKGLPEGADKLQWALDYVGAVEPYAAAVKPNLQYWRGPGDAEAIIEIGKKVHGLGMVYIEDAKLADIGSTNDSGFFSTDQRTHDAVTYSPFAGNIGEAAKQAHGWGVGVIGMCLMSNPEFARIKSLPVEYDGESIPFYEFLAIQAETQGLDGIVIGAPSGDNHITEEEIATARARVSNQMLVLTPGVGAQGGEAEALWKYFEPDGVIVNVGRALMFPNGSNSTPQDQAETAKQYQGMLNDLRTKV